MVTVQRIEPAAGQLVRLAPVSSGEQGPPELLPLPGRMGTAGRWVVGFLCATASVLGVFGIVELWTEATPGWWFDLMFTVFITGLVSALWLGYGLSIRAAEQERVAARWWATSRPRVIAVQGRIAARWVDLSEDGDVSTFELAVTLDDGTSLGARWWPVRGEGQLLQPQVPVVGATVRVWRVPGSSARTPAVVDAADPSAIPTA